MAEGKAPFADPLHVQVARSESAWPTPTVNDAGNASAPPSQANRHTPGLASQVNMWPTPRAGDGPKGGPGNGGREGGDNLRPQVVAAAAPGQLNPAWVESLMGLPVGWTDLDVPNDALVAWPGWPAAPGEAQHDWEPARTGTGIPLRSKRLECLGNACVPQQAALLFAAISGADLPCRGGAS